MEFENTCTVSGKWNEDARSFEDFIFWFCVWCKSKELGSRVGRRFPCVNPVMENFSLDLLRAIISYWTESHLELCQLPRWSSSTNIAQKSWTISTKKLHRRCSTRFQIRLQLERHCKCARTSCFSTGSFALFNNLYVDQHASRDVHFMAFCDLMELFKCYKINAYRHFMRHWKFFRFFVCFIC